MATIWVYAPVSAEGPHPSALELLTKARDLGDDIAAVALGPGATAAAGDLGAHRAARVYASDDQGSPTSRAAPPPTSCPR